MSRFSMGKMKKSYCTATTFIQTSEGLSGISYGQRSKCADLLNSYRRFNF